jgi:hypothetical protein
VHERDPGLVEQDQRRRAVEAAFDLAQQAQQDRQLHRIVEVHQRPRLVDLDAGALAPLAARRVEQRALALDASGGADP